MYKVWEDEKQVIFEEQGIQYLQFKKLLEYPEITHCYTLKSNGKLNFSIGRQSKQELEQNYQRICECMKLNSKTIMRPHQAHTDCIEVVEEIKELKDVDGVITHNSNITLFTTSADCTSLLFYEPIKKIIGAVHSGWRGTLKGISKKTVEKMVQTYKVDPSVVICCICPCIRQCCFEVDEDVKDLFLEKYSSLERIEEVIKKGKIIEGKQKYYIDTTEINKQLLKEIGLKEKNIIDSEICTKCHPELFHSYRVEKENLGLNAALICKS